MTVKGTPWTASSLSYFWCHRQWWVGQIKRFRKRIMKGVLRKSQSCCTFKYSWVKGLLQGCVVQFEMSRKKLETLPSMEPHEWCSLLELCPRLDFPKCLYESYRFWLNHRHRLLARLLTKGCKSLVESIMVQKVQNVWLNKLFLKIWIWMLLGSQISHIQPQYLPFLCSLIYTLKLTWWPLEPWWYASSAPRFLSFLEVPVQFVKYCVFCAPDPVLGKS
jgi:hypothetical protein